MYEEALRIGIPEEDLLLEDQATNTLENVLFSRRLLEEKGMLDDIHVVCAVMGNVYSRRTLMTLKQHMPENIICKSCPYIYKRFGFTKENWMESETGHRIVKSELEKIVEYLQKGDIQELP